MHKRIAQKCLQTVNGETSDKMTMGMVCMVYNINLTSTEQYLSLVFVSIPYQGDVHNDS